MVLDGDLEIPAGNLYIIPVGRGLCYDYDCVYMYVCECVFVHAPYLPVHVLQLKCENTVL